MFSDNVYKRKTRYSHWPLDAKSPVASFASVFNFNWIDGFWTVSCRRDDVSVGLVELLDVCKNDLLHFRHHRLKLSETGTIKQRHTSMSSAYRFHPPSKQTTAWVTLWQKILSRCQPGPHNRLWVQRVSACVLCLVMMSTNTLWLCRQSGFSIKFAGHYKTQLKQQTSKKMMLLSMLCSTITIWGCAEKLLLFFNI